MSRRKRLAAIAVGLGLLASVGAFALWPEPITPGLTQENFDRVRQGMTRPEVEALLGPPSFFMHASMFVGLAPGTHPDSGIARAGCKAQKCTRMREGQYDSR
jgi:hypothetical protein